MARLCLRTLVSLAACAALAAPVGGQKKASPRKAAAANAAARDTKGESELAAQRAKLSDMIAMTYESTLAIRHRAPVTAELVSVSRAVNGKVSEDAAANKRIYVG